MAKAKKTDERCRANTKAGDRCKNQAVQDGYCRVHAGQAEAKASEQQEPKGSARRRKRSERETIYAVLDKDGRLGLVQKQGRPKSELVPEGGRLLGSGYLVSGTARLTSWFNLLNTAVVSADLPAQVGDDIVADFEGAE